MEKAEDQVKLLNKGLKAKEPNLIIKDKVQIKKAKNAEIEKMKEKERQKWADHMYYQDQY